MTGLSVVVANRLRDRQHVLAGATALAQELELAHDQVVWVDKAGVGTPPCLAQAHPVTARSRAGRGECYARGLDAASGEYVAFTDSSTVVQPGWREAAVEVLEAGAGVVGGPVLPAPPSSGADWAGFLVDYGPHAVPPYTNAGGDVAGNNVAYQRDLLPPGRPALWKSEVNAGLRAAGIRPVVAPGMRVTALRRYGWGDLGPGRVRSGLLFGTQRAAAWPLAWRMGAAGACAVLPLVALVRLWRRLGPASQLRRPLAANLPAVAYALVAWSVGEAAGYLFGTGDGAGVW
jgi:hypothetical protein